MVLAKLTVALALLGEASAIQLPLSLPKIPHIPNAVTERKLVDSASLQERIDPDNLLARAKALFEVAGASVDEYNHPTRVIGSEGKH